MLNETGARRKGLREILVRRFVFSPMAADGCQLTPDDRRYVTAGSHFGGVLSVA
jgi:hypothetical protein